MIWKHPEKVAHAASWLQNITTGKAHAPDGLVNPTNHRGAGVVGIKGGPSGGGVFLRGQQLIQLGIFLTPAFLVRVKSIGKATPAHIPGEDFQLLRRCLPGGFLQVFQQLDCLDIGLKLGFGAAFA